MSAQQGTLVGYARVSTQEQTPAGQIAALKQAGCTRIYIEQASGALTARPELDRALAELHQGDALVVWRLDRLGRSLHHLVTVVDELGKRGIDFRSLTEAIDTTTPTGRLIFHVAASFCQFEREIGQERTRSGLAAARAAGRVGGRPRVMTPEKSEAAAMMHAARKTPAAIAQALGVSRTTIRRALGLTS